MLNKKQLAEVYHKATPANKAKLLSQLDLATKNYILGGEESPPKPKKSEKQKPETPKKKPRTHSECVETGAQYRERIFAAVCAIAVYVIQFVVQVVNAAAFVAELLWKAVVICFGVSVFRRRY